MYKFKTDNMKIPCFVWSEKGSIEDGAIEQIKNASCLPFTFHHTALMADGHLGYGAPIGGVMASNNVVIPNFIGVDIGCGMLAVKTSLTEIDKNTLKQIMGEIQKVIPMGFNHHKEKQNRFLMPTFGSYEFPRNVEAYTKSLDCVVGREFNNALTQIGTLGGGNHFIEIQKGSDGHIWIMIHSGSRNLGYKVANHYNKIAVELNEKWFSSVPKSHQLAFLPLDTKEAQLYLNEMNFCVDFALANRKLMMDRIKIAFCYTLTGIERIKFDNTINIAHNYATMEHHYGKNVLVHRKGATLASEKTIGIIPGSQGTKSYIVKGKGNPESFNSCSHGAGRVMSRSKAKQTLDLQEEIDKLDKLGVIHGMRNASDLDEAPSAYKPIDEVMHNQKDLVEILVELTPLCVLKG
jgi:tRNA-splicing ligase RtcB